MGCGRGFTHVGCQATASCKHWVRLLSSQLSSDDTVARAAAMWHAQHEYTRIEDLLLRRTQTSSTSKSTGHAWRRSTRRIHGPHPPTDFSATLRTFREYCFLSVWYKWAASGFAGLAQLGSVSSERIAINMEQTE